MFNRFRHRLRVLARVTALLCLAALMSPSQAGADGLSAVGKWTRADGSTQMTIAPCGTQLCAVNTYVRDQQSAERVGDKLVMTLKQASANVLSGTAFDVRRNRRYTMTIALTANSMKTTGCVLFGVLCKSVSWTRAG